MPNVELTPEADSDLEDIWRYTLGRWGAAQADRYIDQLADCFSAIGDGQVHTRELKGNAKGARLYRCQHHYICYLPFDPPLIIAILHERMDLLARLKDRLSTP